MENKKPEWKVKDSPTTANMLAIMADDILSVSSLKFYADNGKKLFTMAQ